MFVALIIILVIALIAAVCAAVVCFFRVRNSKPSIQVVVMGEERELFGVDNTGASLDKREIYGLTDEEMGI